MITDIGNLTNNFSMTQSEKTKGDIMGKDDFMKLLIMQLKNQDPLNPMDNREFASQLAQFTQLEQLSNMNKALQDSIEANFMLTQSVNNTMSATLIGKKVKIDAYALRNVGQDNITLGYELPEGAKSVTIKIYNESGALVKTIADASGASGDNTYQWDFKDNNGDKLPKGSYSFEVEAVGASGDNLNVKTFILGVISAIRFTESGTKIVIGDIEYSISDILEIYNGEDQETNN